MFFNELRAILKGLHSYIHSGNLDPSFGEVLLEGWAQEVQLGSHRAVNGEKNNLSLLVVGNGARIREGVGQGCGQQLAQLDQPTGLRHQGCDAVDLGQERTGVFRMPVLGMHRASH